MTARRTRCLRAIMDVAGSLCIVAMSGGGNSDVDEGIINENR